MSQHDFDIANQGMSAARTDINNALVAQVGLNSGATEPATKFAYMWWIDTTDNVVKQRNAGNTNWIIRGTTDIAGVIAKTGAYTVVLADFGKVVSCSTSGGAFTVTLPVAATAADG